MRVMTAMRLGFVLLVCAVSARAADFDISRMPTVQDVQAIRAMGWSAAADALEPKLAAAYRPSHFAQAGSSREESP